jgi:hypothetical protein
VRARVAWWSTLPLVIAGELGGHWLAYRLAVPDAPARAGVLAATGHSDRYLASLDPVAGLCLLVVAIALGWRVAASADGIWGRLTPSWWFAALPPVGFLLQEYAERLAHSGRVEWTAAAERAVLVGVALQVPCGFLCVLLVRVLLRLADALGRELARLAPPRSRRVRVAARRAASLVQPPGVLALGGVGERAPPSLR